MKLSNVRRGSSGEPPSASCTDMKGTPPLARASAPLRSASCGSRAGTAVSAARGLMATGRIVAERTLNSRRVIDESSACQLLSTFSL